MQIKTAVRYYLTPVRMVNIKNTNTIVDKDVKKKECLCTGVQTGVVTMEDSMAFPQKVKNGITL